MSKRKAVAWLVTWEESDASGHWLAKREMFWPPDIQTDANEWAEDMRRKARQYCATVRKVRGPIALVERDD